MRAPFTLRLLVSIAALVITCTAVTQNSLSAAAFMRGEVLYVQVTPLARALGVVAYGEGGVLTWRGPFGPVTLFAGSPDALAQVPDRTGPTDVALSAAVLELSSGWFVPLDALPLLGVDVPANTTRPEQFELPDGRALPLEYVRADSLGLEPPNNAVTLPGAAGASVTSGRASWEVAEAPLVGVRFFDGEGVSLLLVDLALVPLARPELVGEVDLALERAREAGSDHVLLLMVTSVTERPWSPLLVFHQDERRTEVRPPYRLVLESGDEGEVTPSSPVIGAVLLPNSFSLYRPMRVEWAGAEAEVRFRR